jgi:D-3-phosphoglycerate dehydrogenase
MIAVAIAYSTLTGDPLEHRLLGAEGLMVHGHDSVDAVVCGPVAATAEALMVTTQAVGIAELERLPALRLVSRVGTGLDAIDLDAAAARGVWVANVGDYAVEEVATHVLALLLAAARRLPAQLQRGRRAGWPDAHPGTIRRLRGQTLGLVGFGRIGREVARKAQGVGLRVIVDDPYADPAQLADAGVEAVDRTALLERADWVSLHAPLTEETEKTIDADALARMRPHAFLLNAARGGLVDEAALLEAVRAERIAGAALDVLANEPPAADDPLLAEERIWLTPHRGWYSREAEEDVVVGACEDVVRVLLRGEPPRNAVNAPLGAGATP